MPSFVPRNEPARKRDQLLDRSEDLRLAILHGKSEIRLQKLAERYRLASISLIKARIHNNRELEFQNRKPLLDIEKLEKEKLCWEQKSLNTIIIEFNKSLEKTNK